MPPVHAPVPADAGVLPIPPGQPATRLSLRHLPRPAPVAPAPEPPMLNSVLGALSAGVAIDVGTANTRIHVVGRGVVIDTPTVVAIHEDRSGRRRVLATGREAARMIGRAPDDVRVVRPVRDGAIVDFEVLEAFLRLLMVHVHGRRLWVGPKVAVAVPHMLSDMEVRVVRETFEKAGAREVQVVERPIAAALGVGLPIDDACGHMVIDIGAGSSSVSVLSLGEVVDSRTLHFGGEHIDADIVEQFRDQHGLLVSQQAAEHADLQLSGHTHGGQFSPLVNPARLVLRHGYIRGRYERTRGAGQRTDSKSQLYVNRGFGTAGPPARIGSPPEVTKIILTT